MLSRWRTISTGRRWFCREDPVRFAQVVSAQAYLRNLTEVIVFDGSGKILARSGLSFALVAWNRSPTKCATMRSKGDVVLIVNDNDDRVRALVRLDNFVDTYLFVGRPVEAESPRAYGDDAESRQRIQAIGRQALRAAGDDLADFRRRRACCFCSPPYGSALISLRALCEPISDLIGAADRVRGGDLARARAGGREGRR